MLCIYLGVLRKRIFSPVYLYALVLSFYPITVWLYTDFLPRDYLPEIFPNFRESEIDEFYLISAFSVMGLLTADFLISRSKDYLLYFPNELGGRMIFYRKVAGIFALLLVVGMSVYVYLNKDSFISAYIYQLLRASNFDSELSDVLANYNMLEVLFLTNVFFLYVLYDGQPHKTKLFLISISIFLILKVAIGSRLMIVPIILMGLLFFRRVDRRNIGNKDKKQFLKITAALSCVILLFIFMNYYRDRDGQKDFRGGFVDFTQEYLFASISALHSVSYVDKSAAPNGVGMALDGVVAIIPSVFIGGASAKNDILEFSRWKDSVGGYSEISPVGGYYMPGQVYLMVKSKFFCFFVFLGLGLFLCRMECLFYKSKSTWVKVSAAQICCFGLVYGVRSEFWIFEKILIQQALLITYLTYLCYVGIYKISLLKND